MVQIKKVAHTCASINPGGEWFSLMLDGGFDFDASIVDVTKIESTICYLMSVIINADVEISI